MRSSKTAADPETDAETNYARVLAHCSRSMPPTAPPATCAASTSRAECLGLLRSSCERYAPDAQPDSHHFPQPVLVFVIRI